MEGKSQEAEELIARFASSQRGNVTRRQLIEAGVSPAMIERRVRGGSLRPMLRGVHFAGHGSKPPLALEAAAVLACAPRALLSADPNRRGARTLATLLGAERSILVTESEAEAHCLALMRRHGLEPSGSQVRIGPYCVDFLFAKRA